MLFQTVQAAAAEGKELPQSSTALLSPERENPSQQATRNAADSGLSLAFLADLPHVPCFRIALLQGAFAGFTLTAFHAFHEYRKVRQQGTQKLTRVAAFSRIAGLGTVDFAVRSILAFSALSWLVCRYQYRQERDRVRALLSDALVPSEKQTPNHATDPLEKTTS